MKMSRTSDEINNQLNNARRLPHANFSRDKGYHRTSDVKISSCPQQSTESRCSKERALATSVDCYNSRKRRHMRDNSMQQAQGGRQGR